jgi:hypothetical protein
MPNHYGGDLLHTMAISGLSRARTELFELTVVPALAPSLWHLRGGQSGDSFAAGPWKFTFLAGSSSAGRASPREEYLSQ